MLFMLFMLFVKRAFCPDLFDHVGKRLDKKGKVNFKIYDATALEANNCNTHISQYLKK